MTIRFLKPAKSDITVELKMTEDEVNKIAADTAENGKCEFVLEGNLKDDSGEVVATCKGTYQLRTFGT